MKTRRHEQGTHAKITQQYKRKKETVNAAIAKALVFRMNTTTFKIILSSCGECVEKRLAAKVRGREREAKSTGNGAQK